MTVAPSTLKVNVVKGAARQPLRDLAPKSNPEAEVELTDARPVAKHGWRSKGASKTPFSLSVQVTPQVLDVFTSPKGDVSDRRRVFFLGESMQWNVVHRVDPLIKKVPYNVAVHLQRLGLGSFAENAARIESVFPIESSLSANFKYQFQATLNSWSWVAVPPFNGTITGTADQIVQGIAGGGFGLIAHPGIWRMSAVVTVPSSVQRAYHLRSFAWDYEIVGTPRSND